MTNSNIKAFREARIWLDKKIAKKGTKILFSMSTNKEFIKRIGGIPHSFNYRKEWPKKVQVVMRKTGLVKLINDIHFKNETFNNAWRNK